MRLLTILSIISYWGMPIVKPQLKSFKVKSLMTENIERMVDERMSSCRSQPILKQYFRLLIYVESACTVLARTHAHAVAAYVTAQL